MFPDFIKQLKEDSPFVAFIGHGVPHLTDMRQTGKIKKYFPKKSKFKTVVISPHNTTENTLAIYYPESPKPELFGSTRGMNVVVNTSYNPQMLMNISSTLSMFADGKYDVEFVGGTLDHGSIIGIIDTIEDEFPLFLGIPEIVLNDVEMLTELFRVLNKKYNIIFSGNIIHRLDKIENKDLSEPDDDMKSFDYACYRYANEKHACDLELITMMMDKMNPGSLDHFLGFLAACNLNLDLFVYVEMDWEENAIKPDCFLWQ